MTEYTMAVTCESPFEETLMAVRAGLVEQGFGVITEIALAGIAAEVGQRLRAALAGLSSAAAPVAR